MEELTTIDSILSWIEKSVKEKQPIDSHTWVRAGLSIVSLMGEEHEKLYSLQQEVAQLRCTLLDAGESVAKARSKVEATNEYKKYHLQKSRIDRIQEMIRLSKIQSRLSDFEYKHGN